MRLRENREVLMLERAALQPQHASRLVGDRERLARQPRGQAGEVEPAGRLAEAQRVPAADDQKPQGLVPQAEQGQGAFGSGRGPAGAEGE